MSLAVHVMNQNTHIAKKTVMMFKDEYLSISIEMILMMLAHPLHRIDSVCDISKSATIVQALL